MKKVSGKAFLLFLHPVINELLNRVAAILKVSLL